MPSAWPIICCVRRIISQASITEKGNLGKGTLGTNVVGEEGTSKVSILKGRSVSETMKTIIHEFAHNTRFMNSKGKVIKDKGTTCKLEEAFGTAMGEAVVRVMDGDKTAGVRGTKFDKIYQRWVKNTVDNPSLPQQKGRAKRLQDFLLS